MAQEAWEKAQRILREKAQINSLKKYTADPVGFCRDVLGDDFTADVTQVMESVRDNRVTIARSGNATGKALPVNTPIPTPNGWRKMGDLEVGDEVFAPDGTITYVTGVYAQGLRPTYKITFNDDSTILADKQHLWTVNTSTGLSRGDKWRVMTTEQIKEGYLNQHTHIPMCKPVQYPSADLPIDPYVLGVLIGDGCLLGGMIRFTSFDDEIVQRVRGAVAGEYEVREYKRRVHGICYSRGKPNPMIAQLKLLGLMGSRSESKFIPIIYLQADAYQRLALLEGLMDTDGYIDTRHSMSYTTVSKRLAKGVQELVWSLGGTAKIRTKDTGYQLAYNLYIKLPLSPFSLPRKAERYVPQEQLQKQAQRLFEKIEYVGEMECVCISVSHDSHLFLADKYIVTHNSFSAARIAVWFLRVFPDSQVYMTAAPPLENLRRILWGHVMEITHTHPNLFVNDKITSGRLEIARSPRSFISGVAIPTSGTAEERESKFAGKHAPHMLFIVDEGDAVPEEVYKGIKSCMSGEHDRLLIMFNPRASTGPVHYKETHGQANVVELSAIRHPNVTTGKNVFPGAVTRETTVRRINMWTRPLAPHESVDADCWQVPDFLVGLSAENLDGTKFAPLESGWRKVTNPAFNYMVLGQYPAQSSQQLISRAWIDIARTRYDLYVAKFGDRPPDAVQPIMGVDVAEMGVDANTACFRYGGYVSPFTSWRGVDPDDSSNRALELYRSRNAKVCMVDGTGVGSSVAPSMARRGRGDKEPVRAISVKVAGKPSKQIKSELGEFQQLRDQLWWALREWLRTDQSAMLPPDRLLLQELGAPLYSVKENGKIKVSTKDDMREALRRSPDRADALCLTFLPMPVAKVIRLDGRVG